jgi:hypothetical protein
MGGKKRRGGARRICFFALNFFALFPLGCRRLLRPLGTVSDELVSVVSSQVVARLAVRTSVRVVFSLKRFCAPLGLVPAGARLTGYRIRVAEFNLRHHWHFASGTMTYGLRSSCDLFLPDQRDRDRVPLEK